MQKKREMTSAAAPTCAKCEECNVTGAILGSIFGTIAVLAVILILIYLIYRLKTKDKRARKELEVDPKHQLNYNVYHEDSAGKKAYDNPSYSPEKAGASFAEKGFAGYVPCKEYSSPTRDQWLKGGGAAAQQKGDNKGAAEGKKQPAGLAKTPNAASKTLPVLTTAQEIPNSKFGSRQSLDDSFLTWEPELVNVCLQSTDPIGLGFNIKGSMRDGIYVDKVLHRGPAVECGKIEADDRILKVGVSFENIVFEDALTILSYASPYQVEIGLQKSTPRLRSQRAINSLNNLHHPVYKSQSMDDLRQIGLNKKWKMDKTARTGSNIHSTSSSSDVDNFTVPDTTLDANIMMSESGKRTVDESYHPEPVASKEVKKRKQEVISEAYNGLPDEDKKALYRLSYEEPDKSDSDSGTDVQQVTLAQVHAEAPTVEKSETIIVKASPTDPKDIGYFTLNGDQESHAPLRLGIGGEGTDEISPTHSSESDRGTMSSEGSPTHSPPATSQPKEVQHSEIVVNIAAVETTN